MLHTVGAKAGNRLYDLGAGTGKVVSLAWMAGLYAAGIELSEARWKVSCKAVEKVKDVLFSDGICAARHGQRMDMLCASFLDVDFTDADIIFVCNVTWTAELLNSIASIARWMKLGSRIVTYHKLAGTEFKELGRFTTPTSWSEQCPWIVQEVVANPPDKKDRPQGLR